MADSQQLGLLICFLACFARYCAATNATDVSVNKTQTPSDWTTSTTEVHRVNSKPLFSSLPAVTKAYPTSNSSSAVRTSLAYNLHEHYDHFTGTSALLIIVILVGLTSIFMIFFWNRYCRVKRNDRDLRYHYTSLDQTLVVSPCSSPELHDELGFSFKGTVDSSDDEELLQ